MMALNYRALSPERARSAALGILAGATLAVVALVTIPVYLGHRHYDKLVADSSDKLERFRRIAATRPHVVRSLEAVRAKESKKFYLRAGGAALAAAEVQETMRTLIEGSGAKTITMQVPAAKDEGRYRQVPVNVQLFANIVAMRRILHAVETGTPHLFIDNLVVRTQVPATFKPGPGEEREMFVQFDVYGYGLTGQP